MNTRKEELDRMIYKLELELERERMKFEMKRREIKEKQKSLIKEWMRIRQDMLE